MHIRLTPEEFKSLSSFAHSEYWQTLESFIQKEIQTRTRMLTENRFNDLSEVSSLQGEIRGLRWIISFVNNILNSKPKGD